MGLLEAGLMYMGFDFWLEVLLPGGVALLISIVTTVTATSIMVKTLDKRLIRIETQLDTIQGAAVRSLLSHLERTQHGE